MIDIAYLKTLFYTQKINKQGKYYYFVKRSGEYCIDYIDDIIPTQGIKQLPLWGISYYKPWEVLLMKIWLKEKRGFQGVENSRPFEFIEAFGMPGYRVFSFNK
eukprot:GHVR01166812.1.p2 GENE.GHVR01166812.1~~GHVR01166812.1.p2  ORF type:complete len:103 (-),score=3.89 GHVR01166812.1:1383-1691(-)